MNKRTLLFFIMLVVFIVVLGWVFININRGQTQAVPSPEPSLPSWTNLPKTIDSQGTVMYKNTADYQIYFSPQTNRYIIALYGSPLKEVLSKAEQEFLDLLQIPPHQACQLNVYVTTVDWFNHEDSYSSFSLSFCQSTSPSPTGVPHD